MGSFISVVFAIIMWTAIGIGFFRVKGCMERNAQAHGGSTVRHGTSGYGPTGRATRAVQTNSAPVRYAPSGNYDPVNRPQDVVRIFNVVSATTTYPTGPLYGHWRSESSEVYGDRGGAGGCNVLEQYAIRDRWLPGNGTRNREALYEIARTNGWSDEFVRNLQGSCGDSTMEVNLHNFGGCIGPMQITPVEWVADMKEFGLPVANPLELYWSVLYTGYRLNKARQKAIAGGAGEYEAISLASRKYAGNAKGKRAWNYYEKKVVKRWREWDDWKQRGVLEREVAKIAEARGRKWRGSNRLYASN